jgi:hypothetical protein
MILFKFCKNQAHALCGDSIDLNGNAGATHDNEEFA